eukprot:3076750-Prymnesium_polylepis.1
MKAELAALGYEDAEIAALEPERAAAIIARGIARPGKGVPQKWNRRVSPFSKLRSSKLLSQPAALGGALGSIAVVVSTLLLLKPKPKPSAAFV